MSFDVWQQCLGILKEEYPPQQYNTWLRPLQIEMQDEILVLLAPNRFVSEWVEKHFFSRIKELITQISANTIASVNISVGNKITESTAAVFATAPQKTIQKASPKQLIDHYKSSFLNKNAVFPTFVVGKSNELAQAACLQVAEKPGEDIAPPPP